MTLYEVLKILHIVGAGILFGTGAGIAYFQFMAHRSRDPRFIAATAGVVVSADFLFTASAVVMQPVTGAWLVIESGRGWGESWILLALALYIFVGCCWLPVVWIQIKLRNLARAAVAAQTPLSPAYHRLFRVWFILGWPAFAGVGAIVWLMVVKPEF
jgi:uncharacterized membrane protein